MIIESRNENIIRERSAKARFRREPSLGNSARVPFSGSPAKLERTESGERGTYSTTANPRKQPRQ